MQAIQPVPQEDSAGFERGILSNMIKMLAQSPRALEGYIQFKSALAGGILPPTIGERIALVVAQTNLCEYSLAEHAHVASLLGLNQGEILETREARALDSKTSAILRFARAMAAHKSECLVVALRENGCSDAEILEVIAHVALNVFENFVNEATHTELDFPRLERSAAAA